MAYHSRSTRKLAGLYGEVTLDVALARSSVHSDRQDFFGRRDAGVVTMFRGSPQVHMTEHSAGGRNLLLFYVVTVAAAGVAALVVAGWGVRWDANTAFINGLV